MINALHLLWVIPLSVCFGYFVAALMVIGRDAKENSEEVTQRESTDL